MFCLKAKKQAKMKYVRLKAIKNCIYFFHIFNSTKLIWMFHSTMTFSNHKENHYVMQGFWANIINVR